MYDFKLFVEPHPDTEEDFNEEFDRGGRYEISDLDYDRWQHSVIPYSIEDTMPHKKHW